MPVLVRKPEAEKRQRIERDKAEVLEIKVQLAVELGSDNQPSFSLWLSGKSIVCSPHDP